MFFSVPQPKQTKGRCLAHSREEAGLYCYCHLGLAMPAQSVCLFTEDSKGFCNPAHWGQGKGDFGLKKTLVLRPGLDQHAGDPGPLPCEFFLQSHGIQTSSIRESLALPFLPELGWARDS